MEHDCSTRLNKPNTDAMISLTCPACSYEFPMSAAVLRGLRANIANDLQADLKRREQQLEAKLRGANEKESAAAKKSAEIDQCVEALVEAQIKGKLEEV